MLTWILSILYTSHFFLYIEILLVKEAQISFNQTLANRIERITESMAIENRIFPPPTSPTNNQKQQ